MITCDRQWVVARRAAVAALHPDRGGDPDGFIAALAAVDIAHGRHAAGGGIDDVPLIVLVRHRRWRRVLAVIRRGVHRVPGTTRHYAHL